MTNPTLDCQAACVAVLVAFLGFKKQVYKN